MTLRLVRTLSVSALCLLPIACVQTGPVPVPAPRQKASAATNFDQRKAFAARLEREGRLAEARLQWEVMKTVYGRNPEIDRRLKATEAAIREQAEKHAAAGEIAMKKGQTKRARQEYLKTLSLNPSHKLAKQRLREIEGKRVLGSKQNRLMMLPTSATESKQ